MQHSDFHISLNELENNLVSLSHTINQHEFLFLEKVRAFDVRQG